MRARRSLPEEAEMVKVCDPAPTAGGRPVMGTLEMKTTSPAPRVVMVSFAEMLIAVKSLRSPGCSIEVWPLTDSLRYVTGLT